ncbi:neudesin [Drosophila tropicalis]|uniref:neudesin n=1 Tax=Drosophila tropicalis TaxID=46794 RepID=UPI0035AC1A92
MQIHLSALTLNMTAAANLLRPVLMSPISQVVVSFAFGYYATTKIGQFLAILCRPTLKYSDVSEKQDETQLNESPRGKDVILLSLEQLSAYNGQQTDQPIYTALNGKIYDLSPSRMKFSNHGPYSLIAGCDANQVLNIACGPMGVSVDDVVDRWERSLNAEFSIVGYLVDAELTDEKHQCLNGCTHNNEDDPSVAISEPDAEATSEL